MVLQCSVFLKWTFQSDNLFKHISILLEICVSTEIQLRLSTTRLVVEQHDGVIKKLPLWAQWNSSLFEEFRRVEFARGQHVLIKGEKKKWTRVDIAIVDLRNLGVLWLNPGANLLSQSLPYLLVQWHECLMECLIDSMSSRVELSNGHYRQQVDWVFLSFFSCSCSAAAASFFFLAKIFASTSLGSLLLFFASFVTCGFLQTS